MKTLRYAALALAVSGVFTLGAKAASTTDWWDVDFEALADYVPDDPAGAMVALTNDFVTHEGVPVSARLWPAGLWKTLDGDETIVTNSYFPTNTFKSFGQDTCLKLDTQGNDLTWELGTNGVNDVKEKAQYLVDADLYLVGSDSAPDTGDFDAVGDVQTAIYLKNETDEDSGETTNSVLCVYVWDADNEGSYWQELKGVDLEDNAWARIQVVVDHSGNSPVVKVFANGVQMSARDGDTDFWPAANLGTSQGAKKVNSVAFRGTGAVDNFKGQVAEGDKAFFKAQVYLYGDPDETMSQTTPLKVSIGSSSFAEFTGFYFDDYPTLSYALSKIEILDFENNVTETYTYTYDRDNQAVIPSATSPNIHFETAEDDGEEYQTGEFSVKAVTAGAVVGADPEEPITIVKIYFDELPEEGTYNAIATTTVGATTTTDLREVKPSEFEGGATKTITWDFPAAKDGNILSTIQVSNGASLDYASRTATVSITLDEPLQENTTFAEATYVAGSLADDQDLRWTESDGLYTFEAYVPPVAIYVADVEGVPTTNEFASLRAAIAAAPAGQTVYLVMDDSVSFTAEAPEIEIAKDLTIDGGSHTLYGVTDFSGGYHDIYISAGNVTIKDLKLSEFGDTAAFNRDTYPIWTPVAYDGELVLDGVTIDKFVRTAVNLNGGTVLITNCTFTADPTAYYQTGVETLNAVVTVVDTTITGVNSTIEGEDADGAAVFTLNGYDQYTGTGTITVLSGNYEGQFIVAVNPNATGSAILSNGTFVATAPATESAFLVDGQGATIEVAGGWYDREPEEEFIPAGLVAQFVDPDAVAPWTVGKSCSITFWAGDELDGQPAYFATNVFSGSTGYGPAEDPTKEADAQYAYVFTGWSNEVSGAVYATADLPAVEDDATYLATYSVILRSYDITFWDGSEAPGANPFFATNAPYGATGYGPAEDPTKEATVDFVYAFAGWTNEVDGGAVVLTADLPAVEGEASWTAVWTEKAIFTVTFNTDDGEEILYSTNVVDGTELDAPVLDPVPTKAATDEWSFTFDGWSETIGGEMVRWVQVIDADKAFYAVFSSNRNEYAIVFDVDGAQTTTNVPYGEVPSYGATDPEKADFTFKGWATAQGATEADYAAGTPLPAVTGTATYYAVFEANAVEPPEVDAGDGLAEYAATHLDEEVPEPIAINPTTQKAEISFVAPADGVYTLFTSETFNGVFVEDAATAQTVEEGDLVTLVESATSTTGAKFFKIGWEAAP